MKVYVITGITGLLGRSLAWAVMSGASGIREEIQIIGIGRNLGRMQAVFPDAVRRGMTFVEADCCMMGQLSGGLERMQADYLIHCAAPTASAYMVTHPVETADCVVAGTRNMLELAGRLRVKSMVYLSSMEVYGKVEDTGRPRREDELGDIGLTSARSCYSLGKRMAEHYCHIYWQEFHVPVKVARLAQVFGRGVRMDDNRVYMQFARAAYEGRDIVLKTGGNSMGNYCSTSDAVRAVFTILEKGADGEVYNVVNEANTMRIRDMAKLVAEEVAHGAIGVRVKPEDTAKTGYAPDTGLRLSGEKLRGLGWQPVQGLTEMYGEVLGEIAKEYRK